MKVALCTWGFPEFTVSLARALRSFCDPVVVLPEHARDAAMGLEDVETVPYRLSENPISKFRACSKMASIILRIRPDVVHFQGWSPLLTPFLSVLKRFPLVFSWHDPLPHAGDESWAMNVTQRILTSAAERVIVLTEAMRQLAEKINPNISNKLRVIPHGIFDCYCDGPEERPSELNASDRFILFFGRVAPYKGVEDLCEAFAAIADQSDYRLVIAGKHIYPIAIRRQPEQSKVVILNEHISNDKLRYLFRHCSLVVLPYRDATQSGVLMLAYAFGSPVLCTQVGGMPEMVREGITGITVPPGRPELLAKGIGEALNEPERLQRMGSQGAQFAKRNFNWHKISEDTLTVYREAIATRTARSTEVAVLVTESK